MQKLRQDQARTDQQFRAHLFCLNMPPTTTTSPYYRLVAWCGRQKAGSFLLIFGTVWCMTSFTGYYREAKVPLAEDRANKQDVNDK